MHKAKLPISRCYALEGVYPTAAQLAQEYLNVYSNDWHGWRILGASYFLLKSFDKSLQAYQSAVRLGDTNSYGPLAMAALKDNRLDVVGEMIPQLMALKDAKQTPEGERFHLISVLLFYSAKTYQRDVFIKTLEGEDLTKILQDKDIKLDIDSGCHIFKGKEIERIHQEFEAALSANSDSSTNAASP